MASLILISLLALLVVGVAGQGDEKPEGMAGGTEALAGSLFNITKILNKHPDFSGFNSLLSQHKVADMINRRKTITVLAVKDTSAISSHPKDAITRILMNHVILDFYGMPKLRRLKKPTIMTTMLQTTGAARLRQGFINTTKNEDGDIIMGSAVSGSDHDSKVEKAVFMQPYDIVVLEITNPIVAPGVDKMNVKAPAPTPHARAPRRAGALTPESSTPPAAEEPAADDDEEDPADAPAGKKRAKAPTPDADSSAGEGPGMSSGAAALMRLVWLLAAVV